MADLFNTVGKYDENSKEVHEQVYWCLALLDKSVRIVCANTHHGAELDVTCMVPDGGNDQT